MVYLSLYIYIYITNSTNNTTITISNIRSHFGSRIPAQAVRPNAGLTRISIEGSDISYYIHCVYIYIYT